MRRLFPALLLLWAASLLAQSVTLAWDPSPSPGVDNYRIYYGTQSRDYAFMTNAGLVLTQAVLLAHPGR